MAQNQLKPFGLDVLPLIDNDRVEDQIRRDRQFSAGVDQLLEGHGRIEVRHRSRLSYHAYAQHVERAYHAASRHDRGNVICQWPVEAEI
ncbi:hypothetical protein D3C71_1706860 [compost metagenome]